MKKPWQIWSTFLVCLSGLVLAMLWLSWKTIELDSAREKDRVETELARQQAELLERVSSALYRMDFKLLPLISQEASRPHYLYESYYDSLNPTVFVDPDEEGILVEGVGGGSLSGKGIVASPLLDAPPEFVLLHFQIGSDNTFSSPQKPSGSALAWASKSLLKKIDPVVETRLKKAQSFVNYDSFSRYCPDLEIPKPAIDSQIAQNGASSHQNFYSVPAIEKLKDNLDAQSYQVDVPSSEKRGNKLVIQQQRGASRVNEEFNRRRDSTRQVASQNQNSLYANNGWMQPQTDMLQQGVMQPIWIEDQLILFRRVEGKGEPIFQCCWLDWPAIQLALRLAVADLLPSIEFEPVTPDTDLNIGTALTTLPVQLIVDSQKILSTLSIDGGQSSIEDSSGLKMALLLSWLGLGLAAIASALLLGGVMKLSERRAAFVSAVTHELRTPLTTFRMYSEMLAEKMVPEAKQQEYANTLKLEADRLSHLVENVLQFARLERSSAKLSNETVTVDQLLGRFENRLSERAEQGEMKLIIEIADDAAKTLFATQPGTVEQVLFNLVDNACKYAKPNSKNLIELSCQLEGNQLRFSVRDYGPGVAPKFKKTMFQPFSKSDIDAANSAPGVGLGLALCQRMARSLSGKLYHEALDDGAVFVLELPVSGR